MRHTTKFLCFMVNTSLHPIHCHGISTNSILSPTRIPKFAAMKCHKVVFPKTILYMYQPLKMLNHARPHASARQPAVSCCPARSSWVLWPTPWQMWLARKPTHGGCSVFLLTCFLLGELDIFCYKPTLDLWYSMVGNISSYVKLRNNYTWKETKGFWA